MSVTPTRALAVFLVLSYVALSESRPELDQYKVAEREPHRQLLRSGATDQLRHRSLLIRRLREGRLEDVASVPELQVGCEEGFTDSEGEKLKQRRIRGTGDDVDDDADDALKRVRRNYFRFTHDTSLQGLNIWQPQQYQIQRPYVIPVFGYHGNYVYYPPQPIVLNPIFPADNNPSSSNYHGPSYLPPKNDSKMSLSNRFNNGYEGDGPPAWSSSDNNNNNNQAAPIIPTRPPFDPSRTVTHPPLEHKPQNPQQENQEDYLSLSAPSSSFQAGQQEVQTQSQEPTRCTWAIVSCCSANSASVRYNCFEQMGCQGAFWDGSPCDAEKGDAAVQAIKKYYSSGRF